MAWGRSHVEAVARSVGCPSWGVPAQVKDRTRVELVDLPLQDVPPGWSGGSAGGCAWTATAEWAAGLSNGPTEAVNNLIKRVKRAASGFTSSRSYRIRSLLYAGKPNWDLLATVSPR